VNLRQALDYLDRHVNLEAKAGRIEGLSVDPMVQLLSVLGDPHRAYPVIHVTGTNGKGSTSRMITSLLAASGLTVGTYQSPHLERINERLCRNLEPIPDDELAEVIGLLEGIEPLLDRTPSWFELVTAAAFVWFAEQAVDVAVVEVGLLGRYDATNVVDGQVAVLTNIGKDHTDGAVGWERAVTWEKAGIVKPGAHVVLGSPLGDLRAEVEGEGPAVVWERGADFKVTGGRLAVGGQQLDLETPGGSYQEVFLPLHGAHQADNAATAVAAVEAFFGRAPAAEVVEAGLAEVRVPGRFEVLGRSPTVIVDGAHNREGARAARATLDAEFARLGSWVLVVGMLGGKDSAEVLEALGAASFDAVICCQPTWARAVPAAVLGAAAASLGVDAEVIADPVEALARALAVTGDDDLVFVAGSLYLVGELRPSLRARNARPDDDDDDVEDEVEDEDDEPLD
jgi:dihydrofolate synthase / folylpolyglutamate synthase